MSNVSHRSPPAGLAPADDVQDLLDVEEAARIAADAVLQAAIDAEAVTRAADDDAEEAARAAADTALQTQINAISASNGGGYPVFNVVDYGAVGDGVTDDRAAFDAAATAAHAAGGGEVHVPVGTYIIGKNPAGAWNWRLNTLSNITISGPNKGAATIKQKAAMPSSSASLLNLQNCTNIKIRNLTFDGNWGATDNSTDTLAGINHDTQVDPKNHCIMVRGSTDVVIEDCVFTDCYGDFIWVGYNASDVSDWSDNILINRCRGHLAARNGVTIGQAVENVICRDSKWTHIYAQAFDSEPVDMPTRNILVEGCYLGLWWNPGNVARTGNQSVSIYGGTAVRPGPNATSRHWRVRDCTIEGSCLVFNAEDVVIEDCRFINDFTGESYPPIDVNGFADDVWIQNNYVYDRVTSTTGNHDASIQVRTYAAATTNMQPVGVFIRGNRIKPRNSRMGILVSGTGGRAYSTGAVQADTSGTLTGATTSTLTDSGAAWTTNQWQGYQVRVGTAIATVETNTSTVLTLYVDLAGGATAWTDRFGDMDATTPASGTYYLTGRSGWVHVEDNQIDCSNDDGQTGGTTGIKVYAYRAGMRVKVAGNEIKNANDEGILIQGVDANRTFLNLEVIDNIAYDDQASPTCTATVRYSTFYATRHVERGNSAGDGVAAARAGLSSGYWLVSDGSPAVYAGYGAPSHTATKGSIYTRCDGTAGVLGEAGTLRYVNSTGATTWVALADAPYIDAHGTMYFSTPATTTLAAATPAKASGTTTSQSLAGFTMPANNRLTYTGTATRHFHVGVNAGVTKAGGGATVGTMSIAKNGTVETGSKVTVTVQNTSDKQHMSTTWALDLATNDYIEVFLESDTGDDITIETSTVSIWE
jgi:hypothetical protein